MSESLVPTLKLAIEHAKTMTPTERSHLLHEVVQPVTEFMHTLPKLKDESADAELRSVFAIQYEAQLPFGNVDKALQKAFKHHGVETIPEFKIETGCANSPGTIAQVVAPSTAMMTGRQLVHARRSFFLT
jgi:hypothetical protein